MPLGVFEPAIPEIERPQTYASDSRPLVSASSSNSLRKLHGTTNRCSKDKFYLIEYRSLSIDVLDNTLYRKRKEFC